MRENWTSSSRVSGSRSSSRRSRSSGAVILALFGALGRLSKNPIAYGVTGFYTSFFRGTPLIVQLFLIYLALPQIGRTSRRVPGPVRGSTIVTLLSPVVAGIVGLWLNYGAYMTEIFRAGIQSVSHGQSEAAEALGMTYRQKMRRVVLPQALRVIIPPTGNEFIAMMKDTALLASWARPSSGRILPPGQLIGRADFRNLEALLVAAALLLGADRDLHVLPAQAREPGQQGIRPRRSGARIEGRRRSGARGPLGQHG